MMNEIKLIDLPFDIDYGAPIPIIYSTENEVKLSFYLEHKDDNTRGVIIFNGLCQYKFGYPNEEAISGHYLYKKGLYPLSFYEIKNSSWLTEIINSNKVHPYHKDSLFDDYRHFFFPMHDNSFEILAKDFRTEIIEERNKSDRLLM
ncbi:protein kinase family protein [Hyunsoonleella pacifica]|uniref:Uncharacterized protein n=1 Tax=Hyunsoonleella pacifica TaxID=1080224 RepID=A0A4V2JAT9_9FLAO|nr:hypothetical protein [Hyunsoonleella pacifica]TBN14558.1 hypothetical protein EYD46_13385 [Hyunsoonleella pacifica]GGD14803.1 hypothetical protein GCM10011368_15910 [Hyunsoonleella pacifica]